MRPSPPAPCRRSSPPGPFATGSPTSMARPAVRCRPHGCKPLRGRAPLSRATLSSTRPPVRRRLRACPRMGTAAGRKVSQRLRSSLRRSRTNCGGCRDVRLSGHLWQGRIMGTSAIRHSYAHIRSRALSFNRLARGRAFLARGELSLSTALRAGAQASNRPATRPLTASVAQQPHYHMAAPAGTPWRHPSIGVRIWSCQPPVPLSQAAFRIPSILRTYKNLDRTHTVS